MARKSGKARQRERKRKQATAAGLPDAAEIERRLDQAMCKAEAGDPDEAARRLAGLVKAAPRHAELRHALGYVRHLQGDTDAALAQLGQAVDLAPRQGALRNSLAIVLHEAGRYDEAVEQGRAAVEREPGNALYRFTLGNALKDGGAYAEAVDCYRAALASHPDDPEILNNLGIALTHGHGAAEAVDLFQRAATLRPDDPQIPYNRGLAHYMLGQNSAAECALNASLALDEDYHPAIAARAQLFVDSRRFAQAVAFYRRYVELQPDDHRAIRALIELLRCLGKVEEARKWVSRVGRLAPDDPEVARLIGSTLADEDDIDGAIDVFRKALERWPDQLEIWLDLGHIYTMMERLDDARICVDKAAAGNCEPARVAFLRSRLAEAGGDLDRAIALQQECVDHDPDDGANSARLGQLMLAVGDLERGWAQHDRRHLARPEHAPDNYPAPIWQGEPLEGKRLLIAAEQGVGDEIIHGSCIPDAIRAAGECLIECDARLMPLFQRTFPQARILPAHKSLENRFGFRSPSWNRPEPRPDYVVPICSLARWFRRGIEDFPPPGGYLAVDPDRVAYWRRRLDALGPGIKVGLCWRSSHSNVDRRRYYTSIDDWRPLLTAPGVVPVNLQYDDCRDELNHARDAFGADIRTLPDLDLYNDFENMAAMMRALDVVVSVSTIVPCLAAATGQRVLSLAIEGDWNLLGTNRYPWLPDLTPVIRGHGEDWSAAIADITRRIGAMAAEDAGVRAA